MTKLSVIIITRNEARHIAACLDSVKFADEWIVVDSGSTDGTVELAREKGAQVVVTPDWPGFGPQKARALALAKGRWVLSIDADERVSPELAREIVALVGSDEPDPPQGGSLSRPVACELQRLSSFCGQWMRHGDWYPDHVLRLFRRGMARFTPDLVHERVELDHEGAARSGTRPAERVLPVKLLAGHLLHDTMPDLHQAIDKMNRYSTGRAAEKVSAGRRGGLAAALAHGLWAFVRCYILKRGLLDGRLGFVLAAYVAEGTYYRYLKMAYPARPGDSVSTT